MQVSQRECRWLEERMGKVSEKENTIMMMIKMKRSGKFRLRRLHVILLSMEFANDIVCYTQCYTEHTYFYRRFSLRFKFKRIYFNYRWSILKPHTISLNALKMSQTYCVHSSWLPIGIDRLQVICIQVHYLNGGWCHCLLLIHPFIHVMCLVHLFAFSYFCIAVVHITFRFCFSTALPATHDYIFAERERCANYSNLFT